MGVALSLSAILATTGIAYAATPTQGPPAGGARADQPVVAASVAGDYPIVAGDAVSNKMLRFPADAKDLSAPDWTWTPMLDQGFTKLEIDAFGKGGTDFKLRNTDHGQRFVVTADRLVAVVTYPGRKRVWAQRLDGAPNPHAVELLPNGNVAVAASDGNWVRVYAASSPANPARFHEFPLNAAHAVLWDPYIQRLWVNGWVPDSTSSDGKRHILTALEVYGTADDPKLREDVARRVTVPSVWAHDVYPYAYDATKLWVTTNWGTYLFHKGDGPNEASFQTDGLGEAARIFVKAVGNQPSGQIVQTMADKQKVPHGACATRNGYCTDTIDFFGPAGSYTRTRRGAAFYKARVWNPYYNVVDTAARGKVWERTGTGAGTWTTANPIDANAAISAATTASGPQGATHLFTVQPGSGVSHRTRLGGAWNSAVEPVDPAATDVSAVAMPDGTVRAFTVVPGSGVWERVRGADGGWSAPVQIDKGKVSTTAATVTADGTVHLFVVVPGKGMWHRARTNGGWPVNGSYVGESTGESHVAATVAPDGTAHVITARTGQGLWHRTSTGGTWSSASRLDTAEERAYGDVTDVSATTLADGSLHLAAVRAGYGVEHRIRTGTVWSIPTSVTDNPSVLGAYLYGAPDGTVSLGTIPDIS